MLIQEALAVYLEGQAAVTNLLKSTTAIYTDKAPATVKHDFIKLELVRNETEYATTRMLDLGNAIIRAHCRGKTMQSASNISEQVRLLFVNGFSGTWSSTLVRNCRAVDMQETPSSVFSGKSEGLPTIWVELEVHYIVKGTTGDP